jgi:hypothetical protein
MAEALRQILEVAPLSARLVVKNAARGDMQRTITATWEG